MDITKIALILILLAQVNCVQQSRENIKDNATLKADNGLTIDSFSEFPAEIDGCSCYFSNDSNDFKSRKYICVNDFADISFLKISGKMVRFERTKYFKIDSLTTKVTAKENDFELSITVTKGKETGEETQLQTGTIILQSKEGKKVVKTFYGECGC